MEENIYIFGHKNPDPDSICAALAYADLKKALGQPHFIAARCGAITARTQAVLDLFKAEAPLLIETLKKTPQAALVDGSLSQKESTQKTKIALVDHNEMSQAVDGAAEAQIVEIIDHHRLGTISTDEPIFFHNEPVGSSCTIIADLYQQNGLTPPSNIAGLLMGGLISDTYLLQSPTTTPKDARILKWLEGIAGIKSQTVFDALFQTESLILNTPAEALIQLDSKIYEEKGMKLFVAQVEEPSFEAFWKTAEGLHDALDKACAKDGCFAAFLLVTDIQKLDSLLLVTGNEAVIKAIEYSRVSTLPIFDLPKVVSRKKQLIPYLSQLLQSLKSL